VSLDTPNHRLHGVVPSFKPSSIWSFRFSSNKSESGYDFQLSGSKQHSTDSNLLGIVLHRCAVNLLTHEFFDGFPITFA
jgi:hypothetical protein